MRPAAVYPALHNRKAADVAQEANVTICFAALAAAEIEIEDAGTEGGEVIIANGFGAMNDKLMTR